MKYVILTQYWDENIPTPYYRLYNSLADAEAMLAKLTWHPLCVGTISELNYEMPVVPSLPYKDDGDHSRDDRIL